MNIVPFENKLPAHIAAFNDVGDDDLTSGVGAGFPVISIKGKVFHVVRGEERTLVTKPGGDDGEPASSIEVVILKANKALSKVYYPVGYTEGSEEKPTCYSNDGIAPASDAQEPQSVRCANCIHNQWGSKISENGSKVKACTDARRLAVAPLGQINDPMLLRVPAASLKALLQLGDAIKKRGAKYPQVAVKIGFDYTVAHPALTFKPIGFLPEELALQAAEMLNSETVNQIVGITGTAASAPVTAPVQQEAPAPKAEARPAPQQPKPAKPAAEKPAAPKAAAVFAAVGSMEDAPTTTIRVEQAAPAEPKKAAAKPGAKTQQASKLITVEGAGDLEAQLNQALANAGFDDGAAE